MLTGAQVRDRLGIGREKFLQLVTSGELPAIKLGDASNAPYRVEEADLEAFIERRKVQPSGIAS